MVILCDHAASLLKSNICSILSHVFCSTGIVLYISQSFKIITLMTGLVESNLMSTVFLMVASIFSQSMMLVETIIEEASCAGLTHGSLLTEDTRLQLHDESHPVYHLTVFIHSLSYESIIGLELAHRYTVFIASAGVESVTFQLHRLSTCELVYDQSNSVGFTANIEDTFRSPGVESVTSFHDAFEIVACITESGSVNTSFFNHLCAYSMKSCQMGAAQLSQSQVHFVGDQSVFQAQTTVVI